MRTRLKRRTNIVTELSKNLFTYQRRRFLPKGFILPTITMILLVFSLVVSSIMMRTTQSTQATIGSRESQVSYNLATPAVERAKSKIEFLFKRDPRFPNAIPSEELLERLMLNKEGDLKVDPYTDDDGNYEDIYTLPEETRINIGQDNQTDNAWVYDTDIDGDGVDETVVYSILIRNRQTVGASTYDLNSTPDQKAKNLVTRTGPLTLLNGQSSANCSIVGDQGEQNEGWYPINTATFRKNFQVNAVVVKKNEAVRTVSSLEFQQDRQLDMGNKWGVWFRYDLEAYPGPDFNWNGAMHTEGNILWGDTSGGTGINTYLISSPHSCLYTEDASEITLAQTETKKGKITFQGQVVNGNPTPDNYEGTSTIDLFPGPGVEPSGSYKAVELKKNTDSITDNLQSGSPYQFSLDPIAVFTEDRSASRYTSDPTNATVRAAGWADSATQLDERMLNKLVRRPYLDDTYRADDRWGPKPTYTSQIKTPNNKYGTDIRNHKNKSVVAELTREDAPEAFPDQVGLDGYWERRARVEGLRLIVGQRLELGNAFGWKNDDPLYKPDSTTLKNLDRQRRSLRDNSAAVQSTLIYHYEHNPDFPIATLATTVHPGTTVTRDKATAFSDLPYKYKNTYFGETVEVDHVNTDFLTGTGTNGWEFKAPGNAENQTDFAAMITDGTHPLRIALNNLAYFAGDPNGGFPPKKDSPTATTPRVHPYPEYTMWGDFSQLRKILNQTLVTSPVSGDYNELSLADRTTVQNAAATIGLLAYNLDSLRREYEELQEDNSSGMTSLGEHFWKLIDGNESNGEVYDLISPKVPLPTGYNRIGDSDGDGLTDATEFYSQFTPEQYIEALNNMTGLGSEAKKQDLIAKARLLMSYTQIERDRLLGFQTGDVTSLPGTNAALVPGTTKTWGQLGGIVPAGSGGSKGTFKTACDPNVFAETVPGGGGGTYEKQVGMAMALCTNNMPPKYPSLYYIFPKINHDFQGKLGATTNNKYGLETTAYTADDQPTGEPYISNEYISAVGANAKYRFFILKDVDLNKVDDDDSLAKIALQPRALASWKLPKISSNIDPSPSGSTSTEKINKIVFTNSAGTPSYIRIPFLDKAFYDGRQLMQVRSLDVDLKMLRDNSVTGAGGTDTWLTKGGVIYAFREDAIREDDIARPAAASFASCNSESEISSSSCLMKVNEPQDPPNNGTTGVSVKPVDYYPDPARRPHSFRLLNGADVSRTGTKMGISFISDNPIYILGDLNLHQNSSGQPLEEFAQKLGNDWNNFYTRSTLDTSFAKELSDRWRPVEILGDALTVLSSNFCDGTLEDGFRDANGDCPSGRTSSYRNSTLAKTGATTWKRENPNAAADSLDAPIRIDRNAQIKKADNTNLLGTDYHSLSDGKTLNKATNTQINAIFINGLVPSRSKQSYGGLHNFPRYIEDWGDKDLKMNGSFIQLKFSTYATAPWDQEAWEPGETPNAGEQIQFYSPPNRRWGYDVGLQYSPPGPVASRFVSVGSPRNEFYQQLAADDPYTKQLRCAKVNGEKIDAKATDCP